MDEEILICHVEVRETYRPGEISSVKIPNDLPQWKQELLRKKEKQKMLKYQAEIAMLREESQTPAWMKPLKELHRRRKSEQSEKEEAERRKMAEERKRFEALPAWKKQLIYKKRAKSAESLLPGVDNENLLMDVSLKSCTTESLNEVDMTDEIPSEPDHSAENKSQNDVNQINEGQDYVNPITESQDEGVESASKSASDLTSISTSNGGDEGDGKDDDNIGDTREDNITKIETHENVEKISNDNSQFHKDDDKDENLEFYSPVENRMNQENHEEMKDDDDGIIILDENDVSR